MLRRVIAGLFLVGLAIGVWLLWPGGQDASPSSTAPLASATTTTATVTPTTSVPDVSTSTTGSAENHVVETVEEAEAILRELWFGWFEGIYNQDEDRIREVVATEEQIQAGLRAMETVAFEGVPDREGILVHNIEVLRSDSHCLALWSESDSSFLQPGPSRVGVDIIRWVEGEWKLASAWASKNDLWEADCEALLP